jgi:hypothetical protein
MPALLKAASQSAERLDRFCNGRSQAIVIDGGYTVA